MRLMKPTVCAASCYLVWLEWRTAHHQQVLVVLVSGLSSDV